MTVMQHTAKFLRLIHGLVAKFRNQSHKGPQFPSKLLELLKIISIKSTDCKEKICYRCRRPFYNPKHHWQSSVSSFFELKFNGLFNFSSTFSEVLSTTLLTNHGTQVHRCSQAGHVNIHARGGSQ